MRTLTERQVREAIERHEFGPDVREAGAKVVVALTQDWCPQWVEMKEWLPRVCAEAGAELFVLEYNRSRLFREFLELKEEVWKNGDIPYLRIYKDGRLVKRTNYLPASRLEAILEA